MYYAIKLLLAAGILVAVTELAKVNANWSGLIKSLPLVSLVGLIWVYAEQRDTRVIADLSISTLWFVLPSLPFFVLLTVLLRRGFGFWLAFGISLAVMVLGYVLAAFLARRVGVDMGF